MNLLFHVEQRVIQVILYSQYFACYLRFCLFHFLLINLVLITTVESNDDVIRRKVEYNFKVHILRYII